MGGSGSSSKRKRKRDRVSSKHKRSRRKESRKRQRRCDSSSACSSYDSLNSGHNENLSTSSDQSMSSDSDSEFTYDRRHKHRRARQSRLSLKSTKKCRERKRLAITSSDSDAGNLRKSKQSRRDVKTRKKSSKKRSRKHLSSSSSYDSESCSTYPSRSSSDGKHLKNEAVANKERARGRESLKAHKRRRTKSPSYFSHSSESNQSVGVSHGGGALPPVDNPRRLRSVIAFAVQSCNEETNRWQMDPQKEEIVYDKEDYPSPRSLDSNEQATKMESGNDYHDPLSNRACVEDIEGEKTSEAVYVGDHQSKRPHMNNVAGKDNDVAVPAAALDDLELILRQKALENLRKFREELSGISLKTKNNGSDVSVMATQEASNDKLAGQASSDVQITNQCGSSSKRDSVHCVEVQKSPEDKHNVKEYGMIEQNAVNPHDGPAHLEYSKEDKGTSSQTVLLPSGDTNSGAVATNACGSSPVNPTASVGTFTGDNSLNRENETTDGSQFEQRTMSVMRGGEMVQVSYKVYIPKRTPALARRQLKR